MPRRDRITINEWTEWGLNVFDTVGARGANNPGDVMVVQAMFRYLHELWSKGVFKSFASPFFHLEPNGIVGDKMLKAIRTFQRQNWYSVLGTDGIIHPAKYENRNITTGVGKRLMTITLMHHELWMAEENGVDYTLEIARRFPNVAFWIR
jgi:hypothetical protein